MREMKGIKRISCERDILGAEVYIESASVVSARIQVLGKRVKRTRNERDTNREEKGKAHRMSAASEGRSGVRRTICYNC